MKGGLQDAGSCGPTCVNTKPIPILLYPISISYSIISYPAQVSELVSQLRRVGKGLGVYQMDKDLAAGVQA